MPGDLICIGASIVSFAVFSLSRFQLPYYLNLLFPFFSILTAGYIGNIRRRTTEKAVVTMQHVIIVLLPLLLLLICWFYHFPGWPFIMTGILLMTLGAFLLFKGMDLQASIARSYWISLLVYAFISFLLYPAILRYQAGTEAGDYIGSVSASMTDNISGVTAWSPAQVYSLDEAPANYSFEFYCPRPVERISMNDLPAALDKGAVLVFAPSSFTDSLARRGYHTREVRSFPNFHVSQLTGTFLDFRTRSSVLQSYSIFSVGRP